MFFESVRKKKYKYLIVVFIALFLSSCLSQMIDRESERYLNTSLEKGTLDAVIVPGYPFDGEHWDKVMKLRVVWSYYLYKKGITKNIIYSGNAVYTPYVESRIMQQYAIALGVPSEHIFIEERAKHSTENVFLSYQMARKKGFKRIALATDPFQSKWMLKFYKKHNFNLKYVPAIVRIVDSLNIDDNLYIQKDSARVEDFISIKETETFWQRWRGTRGKNIDFEKGEIIP